MKPTVFIHTNDKQMLGAIVSRHSLKKRSADPDAFDVRFIEVKAFPCMARREGDLYLRDGDKRPWRNDDLQSFTPLRFAPPQLMNYEGRAVVMDPDIFAVGDINDLLQRDMAGKAIVCRPKSGAKARKGAWASSVMLLDCAKLRHWEFEREFNEMFMPAKRDYMDWVSLKLEDPATIGLLENCWNDFDHLDEHTTAPAQHQAQDPALEDRPGHRLPPGGHLPAVSAPPLAAPRPPCPVWRLQVRRPLREAPGPGAGGVLLRPGARVPGGRRAHRGAAAGGDAPGACAGGCAAAGVLRP